MERVKIVTLSSDIMFVNGLRFILTKSRHIKFTTAQFMTSAKSENLFEPLLNVKKLYCQRGFDVNTILMDGQFKCIEAKILSAHITLNTCSEDEHVSDIERMVCVVKERVRGVHNIVNFQKMLGRIVIELVYSSIFWLNVFYPSLSICRKISLRTIMTGRSIDFNRH